MFPTTVKVAFFLELRALQFVSYPLNPDELFRRLQLVILTYMKMKFWYLIQACIKTDFVIGIFIPRRQKKYLIFVFFEIDTPRSCILCQSILYFCYLFLEV